MGRRIIWMATGGQAGCLPIGEGAVIDTVRRRSDISQLMGKPFRGVMTLETLGVLMFHVAIDTFLDEPILELRMHHQPVGVILVLVQHIIVMTIPARVARKIGGWVAGGIVARCGLPPMPAIGPLKQIYFSPGVIESIEIIDISFGRAMT